MLDWQLCQICYPLEIKLLLLLLLLLELLGETRILLLLLLLLLIIIRAGTPLVSHPFHLSWNPKYIDFCDQYILVSS